MANFLYVDNSNVWIEGMHVAAVASGLAPDIWSAQDEKICDHSWKIDFGKLYDFAGGEPGGRAVLFGSRPPANDSLWRRAEAEGFEVLVYDRNIRNKEKMVDTSISTEMMADSYERATVGQDEFTLVSGDADYVPTVEKLRSRGFKVYMAFWEHGSTKLKDACSKFTSLDPYLGHLGL